MKTDVFSRHSESGFSLIELLIVISIMGILLSIVSINFKQWMVKNRVEAQVRQMVSDFSELRVKAFTTKQRHSITVNKMSYIFKTYSSEGENLASGTSAGTYNVNIPLKSDSSTYYAGTIFEIGSRGILMSFPGTIYLDYQDVSPTIDCLKIHTIRINPGKNNGGSCNDN